MFDTSNEFPTDAELSAAIDGTGEASEAPAERPAFVIDSADRADWLLRKLATVRAERELIKAQAAAMIAQLDADEKALERFVPQLREWGAQELARRGGRRKTLPLFHGSLSYRRVPAGLRVADEAAALNHAVELGAVKVDSAAYRAQALAAMKESGEILPGCEVTPESEHFGIKFGKPGLGEAGED